MLEILKVTDLPRHCGWNVLVAVLAANTTGRARTSVREDTGTRNFAKDWARRRDKFGTNTTAKNFNEWSRYSWSDERPTNMGRATGSRRSRNFPARNLRAQPLEQLTSCELERFDRTDLENHLTLRATL